MAVTPKVEDFSSRYWSASSVRMSKVRSQRMNRSVVGQVGSIVRDQEILLHQAQGQMLAGK